MELAVPAIESAPPPPLPGARSVVRDAALDLLAALGTMAALGFALVAAAVITGFWDFGNLQREMLSLPGIVLMLLSVQAPLALYGWRRLRRRRAQGRPAPALFAGDSARAIPRGIAAGFLLSLVSGLYSFAIQKVLGEDAIPQQLEFLEQLRDDRGALVMLALIIAGVAPVCEEFFFRGVIFGSARAIGQARAGAAVSAVLFAIVHFSVILAPFYATFALVMCWLLVRTGTLAAPIAAHMTMNGMACVALLLADTTK